MSPPDWPQFRAKRCLRNPGRFNTPVVPVEFSRVVHGGMLTTGPPGGVLCYGGVTIEYDGSLIHGFIRIPVDKDFSYKAPMHVPASILAAHVLSLRRKRTYRIFPTS